MKNFKHPKIQKNFLVTGRSGYCFTTTLLYSDSCVYGYDLSEHNLYKVKKIPKVSQSTPSKNYLKSHLLKNKIKLKK